MLKHGHPVFTNKEYNEIRFLISKIGKEKFENSCESNKVPKPWRVADFYLQCKDNEFELYWQVGPQKIFVLNVNDYMQVIMQNWSLMIKPI